jgi:hypothetical protein
MKACIQVEPGSVNGNVVPTEVVVFQLCHKQPGKVALAGSVEFAEGYAGDQYGCELTCIFYEECRCDPSYAPIQIAEVKPRR